MASPRTVDEYRQRLRDIFDQSGQSFHVQEEESEVRFVWRQQGHWHIVSLDGEEQIATHASRDPATRVYDVTDVDDQKALDDTLCKLLSRESNARSCRSLKGTWASPPPPRTSRAVSYFSDIFDVLVAFFEGKRVAFLRDGEVFRFTWRVDGTDWYILALDREEDVLRYVHHDVSTAYELDSFDTIFNEIQSQTIS